jgi:hypothetical protein
MRLFSNILRHDTILDWMARPSAEDLAALESLPPEDANRLRLALKGLRDEEFTRLPKEKNGVKVAPAVVAFLSGQAAAHNVQDLKKEAAQRKPAPVGLPPHATHYYDESTQSIMPVQ